MKKLTFLSVLLLPLLTRAVTWTPAPKPWDRGLGTHRIVVNVEAPGEAARAVLDWRRRDANPEAKAVLVVALPSGKEISNVLVPKLTAESGEVVFQPSAGPGEYAVYFLPVSITGGAFPVSKYRAPENKADPDWVKKASGPGVVEAKPARWEALSAMDGWNEMEVIATAAETAAAARGAKGGMRVAFVDAASSVRMLDRLPAGFAQESRWARPGEVEVRHGGVAMFQILVWAAAADLGMSASPPARADRPSPA
ncbi:MAG: DUF6067 family protein [Kiritimatiellia bacterium]